MKEVFVSNYLQREAKRILATCLTWAVFAFVLLAVGVAMGLTLVILSGIVAFAVFIFVVTGQSRAYTTYRSGLEGERILRTHHLSSRLTDDYTAYYNLPVNGKRGSDIDCVIVGPSGLFVLEVKHHHGLIFYRNGIWARIKVGRRGTSYLGRLGDPSGQLSRNIRRFKELLEQSHSQGVWLRGAIVFTNPRASLDVEGLRWVKAIAVKDLEQTITGRAVLSVSQIARINSRLATPARLSMK